MAVAPSSSSGYPSRRNAFVLVMIDPPARRTNCPVWSVAARRSARSRLSSGAIAPLEQTADSSISRHV
jgi:hypothetical protein